MTLAVLLSPRRFADWALRTGTFPQALVFIGLAMAFSIVGAYRLATTIRVEDLVFGPTRSSFVDTLIAAIGVDRTTVLVYMLERSFDVLVVASAITSATATSQRVRSHSATNSAMSTGTPSE